VVDTFSIRPLELGDIDQVTDIEFRTQRLPWSHEAFAAELAYFPKRFFVLELASSGRRAVIGFGGCRQVAEECYLLEFAIDLEFQRRGFGKMLLNHLMEKCRQTGCTVIFLDVRSENTGAIKFYNALGFRETAVRPRSYPDGGDGIVMMKELS